ncbi:hypothetical protein ACLMAJ_32855 [Nocardia sp. KC 131]|jgi:hypothetical protein|uniref:hypothetical protein n=1 Tax=Nocardia arseniciresistens TaxID=3392119 RepID=UPI00398EA9CC
MSHTESRQAARQLLDAILASGYNSIEQFVGHLRDDPLADTTILPPLTEHNGVRFGLEPSGRHRAH